MDYEEYRNKYYSDPTPEPRFKAKGIQGTTLYYQEYSSALDFFRQVFGPPAYIEGKHTHGWKIGDSWLTVFPAQEGSPKNIEIPIYLHAAQEVDRLYDAFMEAGAQGDKPKDTLMYLPVRMAIVTDPFGVIFNLVFEYSQP